MTDAADPPMLPRLLNAREVADATGLSLARLYELTRAGSIPHVRIGRSVRYSALALCRWFDAGGTGYDEQGS